METKRVRSLLRVSSKQQLHDDDIPIQRAEIKEFISRQNGWEFDREYIEKAVSAYKNSIEDREVLMQIMEDAKNHEFDILLAYMSDRIGRREEYTFYISTLNSLGIEVWTVKDGKLKSEEHVDKLLNYIRFWQNEGESKKTGMRVKDAQIEMIKSGKFVGGRAPYGYRLVNSGMVSNHGRLLKKMEIIEGQAEVVRMIYSLYIHKGYGYEKIAKELNERGIPAIITDRWKNSTICSILKNPVYMGYYAIHRREKGKNYKRMDRKEWILSETQNEDIIIINQTDWEKAQEIRESRKEHLKESNHKTMSMYEKHYNAPFNPRGKLSLLGIAYCGYCGKRLKSSGYSNHWTTKDGVEKVSCIGRYSCQEKCTQRSYYAQDFLEGVVFTVVKDYLRRLKDIDMAEEVQKAKKQRLEGNEKIQREIVREMGKIREDVKTLEDKLPEAIRGEYCFPVEALSRMVKEKQACLAELEKSLKELQKRAEQEEVTFRDLDKFSNAVPNWEQLFEEADVPTKRMLLASLIERIDVKDEDINIKFRIRIEDFVGNSGEDKLPETIDKGTIPCKHDSA